ncbi:MAG: hypothetical protein HFE94_03690 [Acutalibacter sp.]|nr:hypothetical protein [Acutalibacter sp.]
MCEPTEAAAEKQSPQGFALKSGAETKKETPEKNPSKELIAPRRPTNAFRHCEAS